MPHPQHLWPVCTAWIFLLLAKALLEQPRTKIQPLHDFLNRKHPVMPLNEKMGACIRIAAQSELALALSHTGSGFNSGLLWQESHDRLVFKLIGCQALSRWTNTGLCSRPARSFWKLMLSTPGPDLELQWPSALRIMVLFSPMEKHLSHLCNCPIA